MLPKGGMRFIHRLLFLDPIMSYNYKTRTTYSFSVYPSDLFGTDFGQCQLVAIMDPDSAIRAGLDIYAKHLQVKPSIPESVGMPNDPKQYDYVQFKLPSGARVILGMPWIDESTIQVVEYQIITAVIQGKTAQDVGLIRQALAMNGFNNVTITVQNGISG